MDGSLIGKVTHFYSGIHVGVLDLYDRLQLGDQVHFLGHSTDFEQKVVSMQINHQPIDQAGKGQEIALRVVERVREGDNVYKIFPVEP